MKRVMVKSVYDAFEYVMQHYYPAEMEEMVERADTYAVISIQDTHTKGFGITFSENQYCKGVLTLYFDDVVREAENAVLFSREMARAVIRFILTHRDAETLLIHCYAGQSRSRAVGAFAVKMLGGDNSSYFKKYSPNMYVYNTLAQSWTDFCENGGRENRREAKYTGNEMAEARSLIDKFCSKIPEPGMSLPYLDKACELADIYSELLSVSEEEKSPENQQTIADLAAEIAGIAE